MTDQIEIPWIVFRQDVLDSNKSALFFKAFPELSKEIDKFRRNPNCSPCARVLDKIVKHSERLTQVYGKEVVIMRPRKVGEPVLRRATIFERIPFDEYEEAFERIASISSSQLPAITYVPEVKEFFVFYRKPISDE